MAEERLTFTHFSNEPVLTLRSVEQKRSDEFRSEFDKPNGLWLSVDGEDGWDAWCKSEQFSIGSIRHRVVLNETSPVLRLTSAADLLRFTDQFGRETQKLMWIARTIDWAAVAAEHSGIIIAPYQWSCRMHERTRWYYGWDCASGCIWDASAVALIETMETPA